ncbi:hypothetical protein JCM10212_004988 [Sporobolomyces blumeae]
MKFSTAFVFAALASLVSASVMPDSVNEAVDAVRDQVRFVADDGDVCPDFLVRCFKDDDLANPVGDIGNKPMVRKGLKCVQKHHKLNTAECNARFPIDCATKCDAKASPV